MTPRARPVPPLPAAAAAGLAACGDDAAEAAAHLVIGDVAIGDHAVPALTAPPGATPTVTNTDAEPDTVSADDGSFVTGAPDASVPGAPVAPVEPDTYAAHREIHTSMRGVPTVR